MNEKLEMRLHSQDDTPVPYFMQISLLEVSQQMGEIYLLIDWGPRFELLAHHYAMAWCCVCLPSLYL